MKLIVGLGNPEARYLKTRHNYGFLVVDYLAEKWNLEFSKTKQSLKAEYFKNNEKIIIIKPLTYMNLSGKAVKEIFNYYKIEADNLLVIHDDLDLPLGKFKFKQGGSSAGHNGIESIFVECGEKNFVHLKLGIGNSPNGVAGRNYVLMNFTETEIPVVKKVCKTTTEAIEYFLENNIKDTMNIFHQKDKQFDQTTINPEH